MSIFSVAKSGLATKETFIQHSDVLKEVQRRGLTPLEHAPDENLYVMIAGQLVSVVLGHKMGDTVTHTVVEPLVTHFGGIAVQQLNKKFAQRNAENPGANAAGGEYHPGAFDINMFQDILSRANIKIPGFNAAKRSKTSAAATAPGGAASTPRSIDPTTPAGVPQESSAHTADVGLPEYSPPQNPPSSTYNEFPVLSPIQKSRSPTNPEPPTTAPRPQSTTSTTSSTPTSSAPTPGKLSRTQTLVKSTVALASTVITTGLATATQVANTIKPGSVSNLSTAPTHTDHNNGSKTQHFNGTWVGFGEELEIVVVDQLDADEDKELASLKAKIGTPDADEKGGLEGVCVIARYRMKFELAFDPVSGSSFTGENVVDELKVDGVVSENGFFVDFGETAIGADGQEVKVAYRGRIGGGLLIGEWISSDGRQGLFRLKHV
ncbi:hypothetical protein BDR26DRAFT_854818 [Obelidium mucronatum]|nr:hypothetical protein BDR26DRAFT_854818 [Obelidium mucronatum]